MPQWKHQIRLKELFRSEVEDRDARAREIGPVAATRVMALAKRVRDDALKFDLEEIANGFENVPNEDDPTEAFDHFLEELYDLGDRERIWIA